LVISNSFIIGLSESPVRVHKRTEILYGIAGLKLGSHTFFEIFISKKQQSQDAS
jgi:hypothetical protein